MQKGIEMLIFIEYVRNCNVSINGKLNVRKEMKQDGQIEIRIFRFLNIVFVFEGFEQRINMFRLIGKKNVG